MARPSKSPPQTPSASKKAAKPAPSAAGDDGDVESPTQIVRLSTELHNGLKIIAAFERKPMRVILDEMLRDRIDDYFRKKGITIGNR